MRTLMILLVLLCFPAPARAQGASPAHSCQVRIDPIDFGDYSGINRAPLLSAGRIEVRCLGRIVTPEVNLILSPGNSGRFQERNLMNGAHRLTYNLYTDAARRIVAGDGTEGTATLAPQAGDAGLKQFRSGVLASSLVVYRFYGRIEGGQLVPAGEYTDQIRVTIEF